MKKMQAKRVIVIFMCVALLFGVIPATTYATIANWSTNNVVFDGTSFGTNGYYNVISKKDYTLVPGAAVESEIVLNNASGTRRQVMHVVEVDPSNPDVSIVPGYYNIDKDLSDVNNQRAAGVTDVAAYYENVLGYNVVAAMNTDLYYEANAPRVLIYNGQDLRSGRSTQSVLCVYRDSDGEVSCDVKAYNAAEITSELQNGHPTRGELIHAVSVSFGMTVRNGALVNATEERTSSAAARSMVGVKEDGTLVIVMNDGRGANNSVGFCTYELGESMLALGCKWAANCDGGGSSSIVTKRAGEDHFTMRCVPCDGAERPTIHSVMVVSNVGPTGELNNVNILGDYDYYAPGTEYTFGAEAIDTHGYAMNMPADATWSLSDATFGTISNGTFISNGVSGDVDIQVESAGAVVGTRTIHVADPTTLSLSAAETTLPYSTADKVRTTTIPVVAKIGEADVFCEGAFDVTLDDPTAASIDGLVITATTDTSKSGVVATLTYIPTLATLTYTVNYGKGSEVLWDFEDGIDGWLGQQAAHDWQVAHNVTPFDEDTSVNNSLISAGQMNASSRSRTFLSTVENGGMVHNGNAALGVEYDFRGADFNNWVYMILFNVLNENGENPDCVLRDTANGKNATSIGMWLYLPVGFRDDKNAGSLALQMNLFYIKTDGTTGQAGVNMQYNGRNINSLTEADIPESRWIYVKGALPNHPYVALTNPNQSNYRAPSVFRMYIKPSIAQTLTYYYDDITLDYSNAVDDRDQPVFTNPCYAVTDMAITLENGANIDASTLDFSVSVADYQASNMTGLDTSTAAVYLDGVKATGVRFQNGQILANGLNVSEGEHTVIFEIYDNIGNIAQCKRTFTTTDITKQGLYIDGHNNSGEPAMPGSVYYIDIKAKNIESIKSAVTTIDLQTANTWELDHMEIAKGFDVTYTVNEAEPEFATLTITKTGTVELTGDQTIVSIPVRVWQWQEDWPYGGDGSAVQYGTSSRYSSSYGEPVLRIEAKAVYGEVTFSDNSTTTFGGSYSVPTQLTGNKTTGMWHIHNEHPIEDQPATCTEDGFSGRTYCDECGSVVDWGTTLPATGHEYELVNGQFVCDDCGDVYDPGTGLFEMNGKIYYAIAGNLVSGWQQIDGDWYYFHNNTYDAHIGTMPFASVTYEFDKSGALISGVWRDDGEGYRYYYGPDYYRCKAANPYANAIWVEIDGETYAFDREGHRHSGLSMLMESNSTPRMYEFTEDGVLIGEYETDYTGIMSCNNGKLVYLVNGVPTTKGLVEYEGDYYYFNSSRFAVTGTYNCSNGMTAEIPAGTYEFGEDYKMINPPVAPVTSDEDSEEPVESDSEEPVVEVKNGIYEENGTLYYYVNGAKTQAGLIEIDGDYYYVRSGGKVAVGEYTCTYNMTKEIPAGTYHFDETGKMLDVPQQHVDSEEPVVEVKNGIYEENGVLYYYVNDAKTQAGLIKIGDDYYYVRSGGKVATGTYHCTYNMTAEIPAGTYEFDETGKMLNVPQPTVDSEEPAVEVKNGIYEENGVLYYYVNDAKTQVGLIEIDGDYYYVRSGGKVATGIYTCTYNMTAEIPAGTYEFDSTGKMLNVPQPEPEVPVEPKNGIYEENGVLYYYVNDAKTQAGLIKIGDDYYYVRSGGKVATGTYYCTYNMTAEYPAGYYTFDEATGKMLNSIAIN